MKYKFIIIHLLLIVILILSILFGWLSAPFWNHPLFKVHPFMSGLYGVPALYIIPYLYSTWRKLKKNK